MSMEEHDSRQKGKAAGPLKPRQAVEKICSRLQGASSDPVTFQRKANGYDFRQCGMRVARMTNKPGADVEDRELEVLHLGHHVVTTVGEFLASWSRPSHIRTLYAFCFKEGWAWSHSNSVKQASKKHKDYKESLELGAHVRNLISQCRPEHVMIQARFLFKNESAKRGEREGLVVSFWDGDCKVYELDTRIRAGNADAVDLKANDKANAYAGRTLQLLPLLEAVEAHGRFNIADPELFENYGLCADLLPVLQRPGRAKAYHVVSDAKEFTVENLKCALAAYHHSIATANDIPRQTQRTHWRRDEGAPTRRAPRTEAPCRRQEPQAAPARAGYRVVPFADIYQAFKANSTWDGIALNGATMPYEDLVEHMLDNNIAVNGPRPRKATMADYLLATNVDGLATARGKCTVRGNTFTIKASPKTMHFLYGIAGKESKEEHEKRTAADKDFADMERMYKTLCYELRNKREERRAARLYADGEEVPDGYVREDSETAKVINEWRGKAAQASDSGRQRNKAKKDKINASKNAADPSMAKTEMDAKADRKDAKADRKDAKAAKKAPKARKQLISRIPDDLRLNKLRVTDKFDPLLFQKSCMAFVKDNSLSALEGIAQGHVNSCKGIPSASPKYPIMCAVIKDNKGTVPTGVDLTKGGRGNRRSAGGKNADGSRAPRPRGQKRTHDNNNGQDNGTGGNSRKGPRTNRKYHPETGTPTGEVA